MSRKILLLVILTGTAAIVGCDQRLETGYAPRALNATDTNRRAYYAPAYSPEAMGQKKDDGPAFNLAP